jgi:LemA protein
MKASSFLLALVALIIVGALGVGGCAIQGRNRLVSMDEAVKGQWAQVENQLQRRYDLIPNFVNSVKGETEQEKAVFLGIAKARQGYLNAATVPEKAAAASLVESALAKLLVLQENYPDLKSNQAFLKLMDALEGTENRLSVERGRYNDQVRDLNATVRRFPDSLWASFAGVKEAEYFKVDAEAKAAPKVDFSNPAPPAEKDNAQEHRAEKETSAAPN